MRLFPTLCQAKPLPYICWNTVAIVSFLPTQGRAGQGRAGQGRAGQGRAVGTAKTSWVSFASCGDVVVIC